MRRWLLIASALLLFVLLLLSWRESRAVKPVTLIPALTGKVEYCLSCHADLPEISTAHPVKVFGCVICHGGEALALEADLAHSTLRGGKNPSDFSVVEASCGGTECHSGPAEAYRDHIQRARTSIQSTYAGAIAQMRFTFGAQGDKQALFGVQQIEAPGSNTGITHLAMFDPLNEVNPKLQAFAENCLTCHLSALPLENGSRFDRFTGCAACHTPTQFNDLGSADTSQPGKIHQLTTAIGYTQCNTCHNRGNYDLRSMTFVERSDLPANRLADYYQPIAHFTRCEYTLDCINCHPGGEAMGDGNLYASKFDIQYVRCKTCHGTLDALPLTRTLTDPNDLAFRLALLNPVVGLAPGDTILVTAKGEPLWNITLQPDGTYRLVGKATGQSFTFNPVMGSGCKQNPLEQNSTACHACHEMKR